MENVIFLPKYNTDDGVSDSLMLLCQSLMREVASRDDLRLTVAIPKAIGRFGRFAAVDWDVDAANVDFAPVLMDGLTEAGLGYINADWFREIGRRKDYEVVITNRGTAPTLIRRLFAKTRLYFQPSVLNVYCAGHLDVFSMTPGLSDEMLFNLLHSWNVLSGTEFLEQHIISNMKKLFLPSVIKKTKDRWFLADCGIETSRLDQVKPMSLPNDDTIRIVYGGRPVGGKGIRETKEMIDLLVAQGLPIEMRWYFFGALKPKARRDLEQEYSSPYAKVFFNADPPDEHFFAYAKAADFFVCLSKRESSGVAWQEMLYLGCTGIFLDAAWSRVMLPKDYPLICRSMSDVRGRLVVECNRLHRNREKYCPYDQEKMREHLSEHHSRARYAKKIVDGAVALSRVKSARKNPKSWKEAFDLDKQLGGKL